MGIPFFFSLLGSRKTQGSTKVLYLPRRLDLVGRGLAAKERPAVVTQLKQDSYMPVICSVYCINLDVHR